MKSSKSLKGLLLSGALILYSFQSPLTVLAEVEDASTVDDTAAVAEATENAGNNGNIIDAATAANYLLQHSEDETIPQEATMEHDTSLPEKFDLRDEGVVTPVKLQNPWGTCWGFSAIAASESSILSEMGKTYDETGLDLSEHHLAYFARTCINDGSSQDGEGTHVIDGVDTLNSGGIMFTATSLFSSGMGPVDEERIPYRGVNSKVEFSGPTNFYYSADDDWTLPDSYKFLQRYELRESNVLPSPAIYTKEANASDDPDEREAGYLGYDAKATDMIKSELMRGRAVSIAFSADQTMPSDLVSNMVPLYLNAEDNKWTHYTFDGGPVDHAVTIVGWDDTIPASDFLDHTNDQYGDGLAHQPEGDGAWIVKNSWGSTNDFFPNFMTWGIQDDQDNYTGYFYLSYYDRSIYGPETFDFDLIDENKAAYIIDQYDFMQANEADGWAADDGLQMANVFTAEYNSKIRALSCETNTGNASVTYQLYLLNDNAATPNDGTLAATATADYTYAGYHKITLDTPVEVKAGQRYAVVVTSCVNQNNDVFYEFSTSLVENEAYVTEYNRKILYQNRAVTSDPEQLSLKTCYGKGVINPGESMMYLDSLGGWADLSEVVPYLQQDEDYAKYDFDNFPIKAFLEFDDPADAAATLATVDSTAETFQFAEPAGMINWNFIIKVLAVVVAIIALIVIEIVYRVKKHRKLKALKAKVAALEAHVKELEAENTALKGEKTLTEETALPEDASAENPPEEK